MKSVVLYLRKRSRVAMVFLSCVLSSCLYTGLAAADSDLRDSDLDKIEEYHAPRLANLRWSTDFSTRLSKPLSSGNSTWQHVTGLDLHKVFQNGEGDYGTLIFQPYLVRLSNVEKPPFFFDDGDDWELTWRMVNFNYTGLAQGKFNIRIGHFEVPFGLEQNIDSNGTLRQFTYSGRGIKADWGASLNGVLEKFEYEIALTRGSGNNYDSSQNPFLISGRIGTSASRNLVMGLSGFHGETLNSSGTRERTLLGLDMAYYFYQWELLVEASGGETDKAETINLFTEASWRSSLETLHLYTQLRQKHSKPSNYWIDNTVLSFGMEYDFMTDVSLSAEIAHDIDTSSAGKKNTNVTLQFRVRI